MATRASYRRVALASTLLALALLARSSDAAPPQWAHVRHDANGTNRAEGSTSLQAPGFAHTLELDKRSAESALLRDVVGDATPELLLPMRGSVAALDAHTGAVVWQSPPRAISRIVTVEDLGGDEALEVLAAAPGVNGGLYVFDASTGALLGSFGGLPDKSGIDDSELALFDVTGDGRRDAVFTAAFPGLPGLWIVSYQLGLQAPTALHVDFEGYAVLTPPRVGRFGHDDATSVIVDQGARHTAFDVCTADEDSAVCADALPSLCLCGPHVFEGVHDTFAFGSAHVGDVDGDGDDELVTVATHALHSNSVSVLDLGAGLSGGTPDTSAFVAWSRRHIGNDPPTLVVSPPGPPRDVNGDGTTELAVGVVNDGAGDTDWTGNSFPDGVDHAGAATLVLDAATGSVQASVLDAFPYGWADVDGNGIDELITSPTAGSEWLEGLHGRQLNCANGTCSLDVVWSVEGKSLVRELESLAGVGVPYGPAWRQPGDGALRTLDADGDDDPELIVYSGQWIQTLDVLNGSPEVVGSAQMVPTERILDVAAGHVLSADGATFQVRNANMLAVGPRNLLPLQGSEPVYTSALSDDAQWSAIVFEGKVWPQSIDQAPGSPIDILPRFAFAEDIDGDEETEIVSLRTPQDLLGPGFEVRLHHHSGGQLIEGWSTKSDGHPVLDGFFSWGPLHFRSGDFDGEGARDVVFPVQRGSTWRVAVLDGDTGALDQFFAPTTNPATFGPLLVADLASADGTPGSDGIDDVLLAGTSATQLLTVGVEGPVYSVPVSFGHHLNAYGDVDDDGALEVVTTLSATADNRIEVMSTSPPHDLLWGPDSLALPSGHFHVLALAELDGEGGIDVAYGTGEGSVIAFRGSDGSPLPGFPLYFSSGQILDSEPEGARPASAVIALDVDADGVEELVVATDEGWVYGLNAALHDGDDHADAVFAVQLGDPVSGLAAGDLDADPEVEIIATTTGAKAIVLDELGVKLTIDEPGDECIETSEIDVLGTAEGIVDVELRVNGVLSGPLSPVIGESWQGLAFFPGPGQFLLRAAGFDQHGEVVAIAIKEVEVGGDEDGDGWTVCGGDCAPDDPDVHPGAEEVCEDGVDQDCDGADESCDNGETGDTGDTGDTGGESGGDGDGDGGDEGYNMIPRGCVWCSVGAPGNAPAGALFALAALFGLCRRRHR